MAEAQQMQRSRGSTTPKGVILRIDTREVEESLFRQIALQLAEDTKIQELPPEVEHIRRVPTKVAALVHFITKHYLSTPLGGQIISPMFGRDIAVDRIIQFAEMLIAVHRSQIAALEKEIEERKLRGEDFEDQIRELLDNIDVIFITIRELMNRIMTIIHINSPSNVRPPLANVKMGYDIVR